VAPPKKEASPRGASNILGSATVFRNSANGPDLVRYRFQGSLDAAAVEGVQRSKFRQASGREEEAARCLGPRNSPIPELPQGGGIAGAFFLTFL
jgi:hypothetical protein